MKENILKIFDQWHKNDSVSINQINEIAKKLKINFPIEYIEFLQWSNGGEGSVQNEYLYLWKVGDIKQLNNDYGIQEFLSSDCLAFGTNGGGLCYGFDFSKEAKIFQSPLGDLDYSEIKFLGSNFYDFIKNIK